MKTNIMLGLVAVLVVVGISLTGKKEKSVTILVAAAASLQHTYENGLIPLFQQQHPGINIELTCDSSGKLQTQIEEGLEADIFMSAAEKQMEELKDQGLIDPATIMELLENKIVLIVPRGTNSLITGFENLDKGEIIAIGDPESVPAGQYAKEVLTYLKIWDQIEKKSTKGTNVTEVLNWVAEGSAQAGIVYATDVVNISAVKVVAEAPDGSLKKKVIYPVGMVSASNKKETAQLFLDFLKTSEATSVFEQYGFVVVH